jgi:hypothetical protein
MNDNFMGMGGFFWWTGVVESRNDPLKSGRVQVRILGSHTNDITTLPTEDLPWALVMLPVTSSGISGIGNTPLGLLEGSWVFGYFRDGNIRQDPVVLGALPGFPIAAADSTKGFNDPNGIYPRYINEPDVNRLAVNDPNKPHPSLALNRSLVLSNITAYSGTISIPSTTYAAVYPHNNVYESESGHIVEFDDTPNASRISIRHNTGTSIEIDNAGNTTTIVTGIHSIQIDKDSNVIIQGNSNIVVTGDANIKANNIGLLAEGNIDIVAGGNIEITGTRIDLNKG